MITLLARSRLGRIVLADSLAEVLEFCDGCVPGEPPSIYFDRFLQRNIYLVLPFPAVLC